MQFRIASDCRVGTGSTLGLGQKPVGLNNTIGAHRTFHGVVFFRIGELIEGKLMRALYLGSLVVLLEGHWVVCSHSGGTGCPWSDFGETFWGLTG